MFDDSPEVATESPEPVGVDAPVEAEPEAEIVPAEPEFAVNFELATRGAKLALSRDAWEAIPEATRAEIEAFARASEGVDGALRTVTGKYDQTQAELRKIEEARIVAETRAKTLEEVQTRAPRAPEPEAPRWTVEQIAERRMQIADELANTGYGDEARREELKGFDRALKAEAARTKAWNEARAQQEEAQRTAATRDRFDPLAYENDLRAYEGWNDRYAADVAQRVGIPKETILAAVAIADEELSARLGVSKFDVARHYNDDRTNLIRYTVESWKKAGIAAPKTETKGPGAVRADPARGLPSTGGRSAGSLPATRQGAMTGVQRSWDGPSLVKALSAGQ